MCNGAFTISRCRPSLLHVQAQLNTSIMQTDRLHLRSQWEYSFVTLIVNVFFSFRCNALRSTLSARQLFLWSPTPYTVFGLIRFAPVYLNIYLFIYVFI